MRRVLLLLFVVLLLTAAAAAMYGYSTWSGLYEPYKGYTSAEQFVDIPAGTSTGAITERLVTGGIVRDALVFRVALWWTGGARNLQAGEYRFDQPLTPIEVIDRLTRGDVYTRRITFPEGRTIQEMAKLYESREMGQARDFMAAATNRSLIADLDPGATDLEGYLFPETYSLPRNAPAARLISAMVERFRLTFTEAQKNASTGVQNGAPAEAGAPAGVVTLTTRDIVTLASLVEKETGAPDERPMIAAVYRNRLRLRMPLQADPTVVYAMQKAGTYNGNIRRDDLAMDSPYNTYKYPGLPPGPIASPGKASLEAALHPADVDYLYFVSRNDGTHAFATTLAEHSRNVQRFQVEYFRSQARGTGDGRQGSGDRATSGNRQ